MTDTASEPNYQDILDKYADSIKSTEAPPTLKPEPELESTLKPEPLLDSELTPESKLEIDSKPEIATPVNPQPIPEIEVQPKSEPEIEIKSEPEIEVKPQPEITPEPLNLTTPSTPEAITTPDNPEELTPESSDLLPPKENHFFKYLFFFSLFIFLIVLVSVVFSFINSQKSLSNTQNTPTNVSPTVAPVGVCEVNGQTYAVGESFPATDGCNSCSCDESLQITCTAMACEATPSGTNSNIYQNKTGGYSLIFPISWANKYNIIETDSSTKFTYKDSPDTKTTLFSVSVLTKDEWIEAQSQPHGILIKEDTSNDRVFVYNLALDTTFTGQKADDFGKMLANVKQIITTFKLL